MLDQQGGVVEVTVDGDKLWVNVDGRCAVRVQDIDDIVMEADGKRLFTIASEPKEPVSKPTYGHDCEICTYLGTYFGHDVYACNAPGDLGNGSIIARYGDYGSDYQSTPMFLLREQLQTANITVPWDRKMPFCDWVFSDAKNPAHKAMVLALAIKGSRSMEDELTPPQVEDVIYNRSSIDKQHRNALYPIRAVVTIDEVNALPGSNDDVRYYAKNTFDVRKPEVGEWYLDGEPVGAYRAGQLPIHEVPIAKLVACRRKPFQVVEEITDA